jgi:hypothetical protein
LQPIHPLRRWPISIDLNQRKTAQFAVARLTHLDL